MLIKAGDKDLFPYLGDYRPINIYKGEHKIAGWKWAEQSGKEVGFENTYNDFVEVEIDGKSYQHVGSGENLWNDDAAYIGKGSVNRIPNGFKMGPDSHLRLLLNVNVGSNYRISAKTNPEDGQWLLRIRDINNLLIGVSERKEGYEAVSDKLIFEIFTPHYADTIDFTNIQIEEGSTATEYEPIAPTPDYPIEINSLNDFDVVSSVSGRNLQLDSKNFETGWVNRNPENPVSITVTKIDDVYSKITTRRDNSNSHRVFAYTLNQEKIEEGEEVTVSFDIVNKVGAEQKLHIPGLVDAKTNERIYHRVPGNSHKKIISSGIRSKKYTSVYFEIFFESDALYANFDFDIGNLMVQKGNKATPYSPAPEDITEDDDHPLIDKINLSLSEPLRSVGDVKDRLFRDDSDGLWKIERNVKPINPEDGTRTIEETYDVLDSPIYVVFTQGYQDKLNNLRSFQDSNYVYTTGSIKPHLIGKVKVKDV